MKNIRKKLKHIQNRKEENKGPIHLSKLFKFNRIRKIILDKIK